MEENKDIVSINPVPDMKKCRFCANSIETDMQFCTFCGKNQNDEFLIKKPKRIVRRKKNKVSRTLSLVSFLLSFLIMIFAVIRMCFYNTLSVSIFGTTYENIIINQTVTIGSLIISMMFLKLGMFLYKL